MKTAVVLLESISPYSQSQAYTEPEKEDKESSDDYEKRTWRYRCHVNEEGNVFIPPMQFKESLATAAAFLQEKIKGKGSSTYTKHFKAGVLVTEGPELSIKFPDDVKGEWLFLNADGKKNGTTRVWRCMPVVAHWTAEVTYYVIDETITKDVFEHTLIESGNFIGIGRFRPEKGGFYGRYKVNGIKWQ